jgi:hypothetical protein
MSSKCQMVDNPVGSLFKYVCPATDYTGTSNINKVVIFMLEMYCLCHPFATVGILSVLSLFSSNVQVSETLYTVQDTLMKDVVVLEMSSYRG